MQYSSVHSVLFVVHGVLSVLVTSVLSVHGLMSVLVTSVLCVLVTSVFRVCCVF